MSSLPSRKKSCPATDFGLALIQYSESGVPTKVKFSRLTTWNESASEDENRKGLSYL